MRTSIRIISLAVSVAASSITLPFSVPAAASAGQLAAAPAAAASLASILPANAASKKITQQSCSGILSVYEMTPALAYVVSGQFPLVNQLEASATACANASLRQYRSQYRSSGWDPATTCTRATNPDDTILVYMTYVFGSNPSTRINGYAVICNATAPVTNVTPL